MPENARISRRGSEILVDGERRYYMREGRVFCLDCDEELTESWLVHECSDDAAAVERGTFDALGNPLIEVGCPNCGEGTGTMSVIEYAAAGNSGREPNGPCSRRCELQLEYALELANRRAVGA